MGDQLELKPDRSPQSLAATAAKLDSCLPVELAERDRG